LTLILGARCTDGVVIVGDTKITSTMGTVLRYEPKLAGVLRNVIFGYAGSVIMYKVFERYIIGDLMILRDSSDKYTDDNLVNKIADAMCVIKEARSNQYFDLRVMIGRQFPNDGESDLHVVSSEGRIDRIFSWKAIGKGELSANPIMERKWKEGMNMKEFALLSYCIIRCAEQERPEESVGGEPKIRYQKDGADLDTEPSNDEIKEFQKSINSFKA
jgi:20S proteasome alpha/beta subunit